MPMPPIDHPAVKAAIYEIWKSGCDIIPEHEFERYLAPALVQLVADEREACARIANEASHADASAEWGSGFARAADDITVAIRARGTP